MSPPRHIAPSAPPPLLPPPPPPDAAAAPPPPPVAATDVIFVNGQAFNGRGYPVCGVANQRGRLCARIGQCPFHHSASASASSSAAATAASPKRPRASAAAAAAATAAAAAAAAAAGVAAPAARTLALPPQKARFKRSWTTDEHRRFLQAMRLHGKGKWKEIAVEVRSRTANQCQSHAQKYFLRQAKSDAERKKKSIHDVTEEDLAGGAAEAAAAAAPGAGAGGVAWPPKALAARPPGVLPGVPLGGAADGVLGVAAAGGAAAAASQAGATRAGVPLAPRMAKGAEGAATMTIDASGAGQAAGGAEGMLRWVQSTTSGTAHSARSGASSTGLTGQVVGKSDATGEGSVSSTVPVVFPVTSLGLPYASMVPSFMGSAMAAGRAAVVAPPPPPKLRVTVHVNGKGGGGMALVLPGCLEEFFGTAKGKLGFEGTFTRVFTRSGGEITNLDEMCQDDMLWLSAGENFLTPK